MKPNAKIMAWTTTKVATNIRLDPSFTIHRSNFSFGLKSLGISPLTSPERSIRISGVERDRSAIVVCRVVANCTELEGRIWTRPAGCKGSRETRPRTAIAKRSMERAETEPAGIVRG